MKKYLLALIIFVFTSPAFATAKFWVGGTGTWDNTTTTHWSLSTGGAGGAAVPAAADTVTFDGASGGGTVTVAATINGTNTLSSITAGAFTGTLDFSVNNPSITMGSFSVSGTGTRSINLGSGTFTLTLNNASVWDATTTTGLTPTFGNATIAITALSFFGPLNFQGGGLTYGTLSISTPFASAAGITNTGGTFTNFLITGPSNVLLTSGFTITNAINWAGTTTGLISISGTSSTAVSSITFSNTGNVCNWCSIKAITAVTNIITANNSFNNGNISNITVNAPSGGGGSTGHIIGG